MNTILEYNSVREHLVMPEYGRNVQRMIEYCMTVTDREQRNKVAQSIISVMGQLNPHLRDVEDFKHKLWTHLFLISGFQLDVDSPYPKPSPEVFLEKPARLTYPRKNIKFGHYGKTVELLIAKAKDYGEGEEKKALVMMIANLMKRSYLAWNRDSVTDEVILEHLEMLSDGAIKLRDVTLFGPNTNENVPRQNTFKKKNWKQGGSGGGFKHKHNNNNNKKRY